MVLIALLAGSNTATVAYEPILVNLFRGAILDRFSNQGIVRDLSAEPDGTIHLLRDVETAGVQDEVFTFSVNGLQVGLPLRCCDPLANEMAVDSAGNRYIGGSDVLTKVAADGSTIAVATSARQLAVDGSGNVYTLVNLITPVELHAIREFSPQLELIAEFPVPERQGLHSIASDFAVDPAGSMFASYTEAVIRIASDGQVGPERDIFASQIGVNPTNGEILALNSSLDVVNRFDLNGQFLGSIPFPPDPNLERSLRTDAYGSIYLATDDRVFGLDPTITTSALVTAARLIALPGLPLDGSSQGEYFKGLVRRAGRTRNNLASLSEAVQQLDAMRSIALGMDLEAGPEEADRISRAIENINGFLTQVIADSPLVVGDSVVVLPDPALPPAPPDYPPDPPHPLIAAVMALFFGEEPFYGRYRSIAPISLPPPAHVELTLDATTATANIVKPGIWGDRDLVRPEVISSTVSLDFNGVVPTVNDFTMLLGSIDINGTPFAPSQAWERRMRCNQQL